MPTDPRNANFVPTLEVKDSVSGSAASLSGIPVGIIEAAAVVLVDSGGVQLSTFPVSLAPKVNSGWLFSYQSALSSTAVQIKGSAGTFGGYLNLFNPNTATTFIQFFNKGIGSVTVGTTIPDFVITLPGIAIASATGSDRNLEIVQGIAMSTGITIAATTTSSGSGIPTNPIVATLLYI